MERVVREGRTILACSAVDLGSIEACPLSVDRGDSEEFDDGLGVLYRGGLVKKKDVSR